MAKLTPEGVLLTDKEAVLFSTVFSLGMGVLHQELDISTKMARQTDMVMRKMGPDAVFALQNELAVAAKRSGLIDGGFFEVGKGGKLTPTTVLTPEEGN